MSVALSLCCVIWGCSTDAPSLDQRDREGMQPGRLRNPQAEYPDWTALRAAFSRGGDRAGEMDPRDQIQEIRAEFADAAEAVFRHFLAEKDSTSPVYIGFGWVPGNSCHADPRPSFMRRIQSDFPSARVASERAGDDGTLYCLLAVLVLGDGSLEVWADSFSSPLAAVGLLLHVVRSDRGWSVTDYELRWVA